MQNDLISRSDLIKTLSEKYSGLCDAKDTYQYAKYDAFKEIVRLIKGEPIAYDVEKTVTQVHNRFEEWLDEVIDRPADMGTLDWMLKQCKEICIIVRSGGKE